MQNAAVHLVFNSPQQSHRRQFWAGNKAACSPCGVTMTAREEKHQGTKEGIPPVHLWAHRSLKYLFLSHTGSTSRHYWPWKAAWEQMQGCWDAPAAPNWRIPIVTTDNDVPERELLPH